MSRHKGVSFVSLEQEEFMYRIKKHLLCSMAFVICLIPVSLSGCTKKEIVNLEKERSSVEGETESTEEKPEEKTPKAVEETQPETVCVYVCGEVNNPGVYELPAGSRIYEVIEKAQGMTENAAVSYLNQAEVLVDGARIYIPNVQEEASQNGAWQEESGMNGGAAEGSSDSSHGKININKATKEELMTLTGIGESKAEDIITYREENGPFQSIDDMKQIRGIKDGVLNKIKDEITV